MINRFSIRTSIFLQLVLVAVSADFSVGRSETIERLPTVAEASTGLKKFSYAQMHMAMPLKITVWAESEAKAQCASKLAFKRASELVNIFSDYDQSSEIKRLLRSKVGEPHPVSQDLMKVLQFSKDLCHKSDGAFNPTAAPVIRLWRQARKTSQLPSVSDLEAMLGQIGFDAFKIEAEANTVTLLSKGAELDFGAVAKGYIGDEIIRVLNKNGISISCYEAGGDIVLGDSPPQLDGWAIDIGSAVDGSRRTLSLKNCAISTSGDTQQFVEINGRRYSHVVDPRTGLGVTARRTSFVIAPSGMLSDALATAGCIMQEDAFQKLIAKNENTTGWSRSEILDRASIPNKSNSSTLTNKIE